MAEDFNFNNSFKDAIISKLVDVAITLIGKFFKSIRKTKSSRIPLNNFEEEILKHFNELYNWSKEIEFIGLGKPITTEKTIELNYYFSRRRPTDLNIVQKFTENDIINSNENVVIEGDLGSGKSTTLKRILSDYYFNRSPKTCAFSYPILIRLRTFKSSDNLYTYICNLLGIEYETKLEHYQVEVSKTRVVMVQGKERHQQYKTMEVQERIKHLIDNIPIENAICDLLENNNILLILDGLDEVRYELLEEIQTQIKNITLKISKSKLIITSRLNYIKTQFFNTVFYQVNELNYEQITAISSSWLEQPHQFLKELKSKSYSELANRPLFLSFLILLYKENQKFEQIEEQGLPRYSKDVYKQIIELLVNRWDKERDIYRQSKYSYFDKNRKLEFLAHLSFNLTYIIKQKVFSHDDLKRAYLKIYEQFELPMDEADQVAEELESHIGIIIKSSFHKFEFSHLAIQEYLCAYYIVNAPFNDKINEYLKEYPSPLALSISLSSDPVSWFYELVLKINSIIHDLSDRTRISTQLLNRLIIETPYFSTNPKLGVAAMSLCRTCDCVNSDFQSTFRRFLKSNNNIEVAIEEVLKRYTTTPEKNQINNKLTFKRTFHHVDNIYPEFLCLPIE